MRQSRAETNFGIISLLRKRATCQRGQVGALLTKKGRVICTGYNGPSQGHSHCKEAGCDLTQPCKIAIHAEANVILFCRRNNIPIYKTKLWCSTAPCLDCARLIIESGITEVHYYLDYRNEMGLDALRLTGIKTIKHEYKESV